jgi:hypothetical protein
MPGVLEDGIRKLALERCEYCHIPDSAGKLRHVLDHIIAKQHGGQTIADNLALCCGRCNQSKGPNIAGLDPATGKLTPLFNPRQDLWNDHFLWEAAKLIGKTPIGRTTVTVLAINSPLRVAARHSLMDEGHVF